MSGSLSYHAGLSAEGQVARDYQRRGFPLIRHRWRGTGGEIDLVLQDGEGFVFVEVKKSRSHARAAEHLTARQIRRLHDAAVEFLSGCPGGLATDIRFDVALVDRHGRIEIVENALCA